MIESVLTGGGAAALVIATAHLGRLVLDWWRERRTAPQTVATSAVTDAAAANSLLLGALKEEREEVQRLSAEVAELRTQNANVYQKMREQRAEYEKEIAALRTQVDEFRKQLDSLHTRLRTDPPTP